MSELERELARAAREIRADVREQVLQAQGRALLERAQQLVPVDTHRLQESGYVEVRGNQVEVGFDSPIAAVQHERLDYRHDQGQAKFLEAPLEAHGPEFLRAVEAAVGRALR